jgi:hypothetical protein
MRKKLPDLPSMLDPSVDCSDLRLDFYESRIAESIYAANRQSFLAIIAIY